MCDDQKLLEAQDRIEAIEGIKRGLESMKRNAGKPAEKFFEDFFAEEGISERERTITDYRFAQAASSSGVSHSLLKADSLRSNPLNLSSDFSRKNRANS